MPVRIALVLGSALCVNDDVEAACALATPGFVAAAGNVGKHFTGRLDAWLGGHKAGVADLGIVVDGDPHLARLLQFGRGIAAAIATLRLYADKVILCGMPEDPMAGHVTGRVHGETCAGQRAAFWARHCHLLRCRIRSSSGRTRGLLGAPSPEWLGGDVDPLPDTALIAMTDGPDGWVSVNAAVLPPSSRNDASLHVRLEQDPFDVVLGEAMPLLNSRGVIIMGMTVTSREPLELRGEWKGKGAHAAYVASLRQIVGQSAVIVERFPNGSQSLRVCA